MKNFSRKKGFTLIELLVVIAIISILSSIILASVNGARKKARNAQRVSAARQLVYAFNLAEEGSGSLPTPVGAVCLSETCYGSFSSYTADPSVDAFLLPAIKSKPIDPPDSTRGAGGYLYYSVSGGPSPYNGTIVPPGLMIQYMVEPPITPTSCGPGYIWDSQPNYIYCIVFP